MMKTFNRLNITPPNKTVIVVTESGEEFKALPTFYHFDIIDGKVILNKNNEEIWDGGWLIKTDLENINSGKNIVGWRLTENE